MMLQHVTKAGDPPLRRVPPRLFVPQRQGGMSEVLDVVLSVVQL